MDNSSSDGLSQLLNQMKITLQEPDLRSLNNISLPEPPSDYNPMANIEEPLPPPKALELNPIMNSNDFNKSNTPLNSYRYKLNS